jgi:tetratricopeptide (TPR) repeat protein
MREINDRREEASALNNLGIACQAQGNLSEALRYFEQLLPILQETKHRRGEGRTLSSMGLVYQDRGDIPHALESYERCLTIMREVGDRHGEAGVLRNFGLAYQTEGAPQQAIEYYEQALALVRQQRQRATACNLMLLDIPKQPNITHTRTDSTTRLKIAENEHGLANLGLPYHVVSDPNMPVKPQECLAEGG